jgi:protein gp37
MLGPISLEAVNEKIGSSAVVGGIDWLIIGGESGPGARPMDIAWARSLLAECRDAGIAPFVKQLGGHPDKRDDPREWPEDLRVRRFPERIA